MFTTTAEFNRLSSEVYKNRILNLKLRIFAKIPLGVIWSIFAGLVTNVVGSSFHISVL